MREIEPKFELFDTSHVGAGDWTVGDGAGTEIARPGETRGTAREFKNTGNKAKKLLKTKDITFLNAANQGSLAGQSAQIRPRSEQGQFGKARSGLTAARGGRAWTNCRLHGRQVDVALPLRPAGFCARSQLQRIQRPENGCGATAWFRTYCEFLDQPNKAVWARVRFSGRPRSRASAEFPMGGGIARPACPLRITVIGVAGDVREFGLAAVGKDDRAIVAAVTDIIRCVFVEIVVCDVARERACIRYGICASHKNASHNRSIPRVL